MKRFFPVLFLLSMVFLGACSNEAPVNTAPKTGQPVKQPGSREPVLVELFTSEGCGNCPPADRYLAILENQQPVAAADVITLGYHVDYFNDRGWKDPYSSAEFTRRQNLYSMRMGLDSIYTPQMIVDGRDQFIGSDTAAAERTITKAAGPVKPRVDAVSNGSSVSVTITGFGTHLVATAVLAVAEDGLVSDVTAGNNRGKKLPHVSVVRQLRAFGKVPEKAAEYRGTVELPTDPAWKKDNLKYIVFVQEDQSGKVIAAGRVRQG